MRKQLHEENWKLAKVVKNPLAEDKYMFLNNEQLENSVPKDMRLWKQSNVVGNRVKGNCTTPESLAKPIFSQGSM